MYLSGAVPPASRGDVGIMWSPGQGNRRRGGPYAIDNGRFGTPWRRRLWLRLLQSLYPFRGDCLFAVVPDCVGDAAATALEWPTWIATLRRFGFPLAFAAQNGCTSAMVPWGELDVLFVGGSTEWKFSDSSLALVIEAKRRGKPVHVGRVNTLRRLMACAAWEVDSCDGNMLSFAPDQNWPKLCRFLDVVNSGQRGMVA